MLHTQILSYIYCDNIQAIERFFGSKDKVDQDEDARERSKRINAAAPDDMKSLQDNIIKDLLEQSKDYKYIGNYRCVTDVISVLIITLYDLICFD